MNKLREAIDYLKSYQFKEGEKFDMDVWYMEIHCGTARCAGGILADSRLFDVYISDNDALLHNKHELSGYFALAKEFNISVKSSNYIFSPVAYKPKLSEEISLEDVIQHMKEVELEITKNLEVNHD